jgi:hypothetical protein
MVYPIVGIDGLAPATSFLAAQDRVGVGMLRQVLVRPEVATYAPATYKPATPPGAVADQHAIRDWMGSGATV